MSLKEAFDLVFANLTQVQLQLEDLRVAISNAESRAVGVVYTWVPEHPTPGEMLVTESEDGWLIQYHEEADDEELLKARKNIEENFR